jgi:hypothetical protein
MRIAKSGISILAVLLASSVSSAHLLAGSLSIKGGEEFVVGSKVTVTFTQSVGHNNGQYDFYFSKDGGTTWTEFEAHWQGPKGDNAVITYVWTIPNSVTTKGAFRACQLAGGECVDNNYILKSGNFTVATVASGIVNSSTQGTSPSMEFNPLTASVDVAFSMATAGPVSLQALDAQGKVIATLLDGTRDAGQYQLSLFSNRLKANRGPLFFKLSLSGSVFTRSGSALGG